MPEEMDPLIEDKRVILNLTVAKGRGELGGEGLGLWD